MRFISVLADKYRKNGYIYVTQDLVTRNHDVYLQYSSGKCEWYDTYSSKRKAIQVAKETAMKKKLGFDPTTDVF